MGVVSEGWGQRGQEGERAAGPEREITDYGQEHRLGRGQRAVGGAG